MMTRDEDQDEDDDEEDDKPVEAERLGGRQVDDEIELWSAALPASLPAQNLVDIVASYEHNRHGLCRLLQRHHARRRVRSVSGHHQSPGRTRCHAAARAIKL